jgi:hypothetical protein
MSSVPPIRQQGASTAATFDAARRAGVKLPRGFMLRNIIAARLMRGAIDARRAAARAPGCAMAGERERYGAAMTSVPCVRRVATPPVFRNTRNFIARQFIRLGRGAVGMAGMDRPVVGGRLNLMARCRCPSRFAPNMSESGAQSGCLGCFQHLCPWAQSSKTDQTEASAPSRIESSLPSSPDLLASSCCGRTGRRGKSALSEVGW